jgi:hypothetical protein
MAPELALESLKKLRKKSIVLDPMAGSGTVLRQAIELGHNAIGLDLDPLAVLMSRVWTHPVSDSVIQHIYEQVIKQALAINPADAKLPWIDEEKETIDFVRYWFGQAQERDLRCLAYVLYSCDKSIENQDERAALDVLKIALSRIIVTKEQCASLARDTSHSRPHRVTTKSDYSVFLGFERSLKTVRKRLAEISQKGEARVQIGDARNLNLANQSVDAVLTSPPYLNAIDYMRGHRLSLVWLGYRLTELRAIRSSSIGAERGTDKNVDNLQALKSSLGDLDSLPSRHRLMIDRYVGDVFLMMSEVARVLKPEGLATFVVGNSCLKGVFIKNAETVATAGCLVGLKLTNRYERELPPQNRYLPTLTNSALGNRMRTESILTFAF